MSEEEDRANIVILVKQIITLLATSNSNNYIRISALFTCVSMIIDSSDIDSDQINQIIDSFKLTLKNYKTIKEQ